MRRTIILTTLALLTCWASYAQTADPISKSDVEQLLAQLGSDEAIVRNDALEHLRSDPSALADKRIKSALIELLDRENHIAFSGDEGYHEYLSWLADAVANVVDWNDPHQVCILTDSLDIPDELADHASAAIPCLLQLNKSASNGTRGPIVAMMVQTSAKGRSALDPATTRTVQRVILHALRDPSADVKIPTIEALKVYGTASMIPAIKIVAETDPDPSEHYAIREWAAEAIVAIQQRAAQQQKTVPTASVK
jgi:hypothetical protein